MSFFRILLIFCWLVISCIFGLLLCLVRWGNLDNDHVFARFFAWGVVRICGMDIQVEGLSNMETGKPCIYVANHQSGIDMATFGAIYPLRTVVVGKKELLWIPFFGLFFKAAGNIIIDRQKSVSAIGGLKLAAKLIRDRKLSVWIFPEGTRNAKQDSLLPFKKGAFCMAVQAQVPIVPVICAPVGDLVSWKNGKISPGKLRIRVLPPIETSSCTMADIEGLKQKTRGQMLEALKDMVG